MRQVTLGFIVILCLSFPIPVTAQAPTDNYVSQLVQLGYDDIKISKTFLGRFRILASRDGVTREIVIARNGQLLFDYLDASNKTPSVGRIVTNDDDDEEARPVESDITPTRPTEEPTKPIEPVKTPADDTKASLSSTDGVGQNSGSVIT